MAHLTLQIGSAPIVPFPGRRMDGSRTIRARALLEAARVSAGRDQDHAGLDPDVLALRASRRAVRPVGFSGERP